MPRPTELMVYMFENIREEEHASSKGPVKKWSGTANFATILAVMFLEQLPNLFDTQGIIKKR